MIFKYQTELDRLSVKCPPETCQPIKVSAFRWVFDDMSDARNFLPVYFQNPQRFFGKREAEKCLAMGLSMFDSLENAETRFQVMFDNIGKAAYMRFGTKIATAELTESDGVCSLPDANGHFTNYPLENHDYKTRFVPVQQL